MDAEQPITVHTPFLRRDAASPEFLRVPPHQRAQARMYGFDFDWYVDRIRTLTSYGCVLTVVASLGAVMLSGLWADGADALSFIMKLVVWIGIGWRVVRRDGGSVGAAAVAAGIAGIMIGVVLALFRLVAVREVWTVFNLIIEPVVSGIFGYCVGGAAACAAKPFHRSLHPLLR